jgi:hypothetical protein
MPAQVASPQLTSAGQHSRSGKCYERYLQQLTLQGRFNIYQPRRAEERLPFYVRRRSKVIGLAVEAGLLTALADSGVSTVFVTGAFLRGCCLACLENRRP